MANFDFSTLNSTDLEDLVRDLLNAKEKENHTGIEYKTFKEGKDRGVDFAYSTPQNTYEIVGQVKHYYRSGYNSLITLIKKEEIYKVRKITPNKYIFATSLDLSLLNKKEIEYIFKPYINTINDIYGKDDLNMYIDRFPSVLQNHFKLWYSSTNVLQKLINYNIEGRANEFIENELKRKIRLYVKTQLFDEAKHIINNNNLLIITGEPGIGKTTLAELLMYNYIKDDYELIYIYDNIKELENVFSNDEKKTDLLF